MRTSFTVMTQWITTWLYSPQICSAFQYLKLIGLALWTTTLWSLNACIKSFWFSTTRYFKQKFTENPSSASPVPHNRHVQFAGKYSGESYSQRYRYFPPEVVDMKSTDSQKCTVIHQVKQYKAQNECWHCFTAEVSVHNCQVRLYHNHWL